MPSFFIFSEPIKSADMEQNTLDLTDSKDTIEQSDYPILTLFDIGGRRVGLDRRSFSYGLHIPERRRGKDRRSGSDRRNFDQLFILGDTERRQWFK